MRRYLPPSAVNGPVSAWGLYKSDDEQTHSDDLCCPGGGRGGNLACAGAGLSGLPPARSIRPRRSLIRPAAIRPTIAAARARRISTRWKTTRRRTRRIRPRCRRPDRCFRPMIRVMGGRWALAGLFRSRRADRTDPFARRSALWPSRRRPADLFRSCRADRPDPFAR